MMAAGCGSETCCESQAKHSNERLTIMQKNLKKLTILHSNDLHGDFLAEQVDKKLVGGLSSLSGYVNKVRSEEKNVIYAIAGDMFRGSVIDSEYQGISTIGIMNMMAPDIVSLGNHEVDYGMAHLLFLEKCADFPIICANMYVKYLGRRLFSSHWIKEIGGVRVLFIGILTEDVLANTKNDGLVGMLIELEDAVSEVGKVCDAYSNEDIDLTVLLTHIGFEQDKKLAAELNPAWGVDIIIGGHSHTHLSEPCEVAGIPIVQAAIGTDQIGRFDIMIDKDNNCIDSYTWQCIPITDETCPRDTALEEVISEYKQLTDEKYGRALTCFPRTYTHPRRNMETELGDLFAEGIRDQLDIELVLLGSGSIRRPQLGPVVTLKDYKDIFPFINSLHAFYLTGAQLRRAIRFMLREDLLVDSENGEWYQVSKGFFCEYDRPTQRILSLKLNGKEIEDDDLITVAMEHYHFTNIGEFLHVQPEEIKENGKTLEISTSVANVLEEYFLSHEHLELDGEQRLVIHE